MIVLILNKTNRVDISDSDLLIVFNQVAVMSGHFELGEIIKNHRDTDVGK